MLGAVGGYISGDPSHRTFGQKQRLTDELKGVRIKASECRASLPLKLEILRDQRSVTQSEQAIVGTIGWQLAFDLNTETVGI